MTTNRYNLSTEKAEEIMKKLTRILTEDKSEQATGLMTAEITTSFVKAMTKVKGLEDVIERNDQLSKTYMGLLDLYGFDSMYDMYLYAKSCDLFPEELMKRKDYSKLVPVKRKVVRNGKETEITVYEDPNKGGSQPNEGNSEGRDTPKATVSHARGLKGRVHGDGKKLDTNKIAKLKQATESMKGAKFKDTSDYYLELKGPDGKIAGVIGYSVKGEFMVMDFYKTNGQVPGIAARGFSELIKMAMKAGKGVKVKDDPQARPVFAQFGLEQQENFWSITADDLQESLGRGGSKGD